MHLTIRLVLRKVEVKVLEEALHSPVRDQCGICGRPVSCAMYARSGDDNVIPRASTVSKNVVSNGGHVCLIRFPWKCMAFAREAPAPITRQIFTAEIVRQPLGAAQLLALGAN